MNPFLLSVTGLAYAALYLTAAAPGVIGGDSPELTAAAHALGPAHPPGYPLYVLLGHLFEGLSLGSPAFRLTLLSILSQVLALFILAPVLYALPSKGSPWIRATASIGSIGLWLGGSLAFAQTLSPEVIAFHCLALAFLLRCLLAPTRKGGWAAAFALGLSLSNHHLTLLLLPAFVWAFRGSRRGPRDILLASGFFLLGLSCYLALPLRASLSPSVNWGNPSDPAKFLLHLTRWQYGGDLPAGRFADGFLDLFLFIRGAFMESLGLGATLIALAFLGRTKPLGGAYYLGLFFLGVVHPFLIRAPFEAETNFVNSSFLPPLLLWATPLVHRGILFLLAAAGSRKIWVTAGFVLLLFGEALHSRSVSDQRRNLAVLDIARAMLRQMPERSVLYSRGDAVTFPLAYLKLVAGLRPDLSVFDREMGLFQDLYRSGLNDPRRAHDPAVQTLLEEAFERRAQPAAVFYSEGNDVPGRKLRKEGLLFRLVEREGPALAGFWEGIPVPRVDPWHDYLSRETAARFHLFKAAHFLEEGKETAQAGMELRRATTIAFDDGRIWILAGEMQQGRREPLLAERFYTMAAKLLPRDPLPWLKLSLLADQENRPEKALGSLREAIRRAPQDADLHFRYAFRLYRAQKVDEAIQEWERTKELDPEYADAYRNLGFLHIQGDPAYAASLFRRYLLLAPDSPDRPAIEKFLAGQGRP